MAPSTTSEKTSSSYSSMNILDALNQIWGNIYPPLPDFITERRKMVVIDLFLRIFLNLPIALLGYIGSRQQLQWLRFFLNTLTRLQGKMTGEDEHMKVTDTNFANVPVRVYEPKKRKGDGAIIFIHGGGFVFGSAAGYDFVTRYISRRAGLVLVSIDYQLAPEHKYPAAVEDSEQAAIHFLTKAYKDYKIDPQKVAVMGDSAGGNLTAVTCQRLRKMNVPQPKLQVMIYPWLQILDFNTPSYQMMSTYQGTSLVNPRAMARFTLHYLVGPDIGKYITDIMANRHITPELRHSPSFDHIRHAHLPPAYTYDEKPFYDSNAGKPTSANMELYSLLQPYLLDPNVSPLLQSNLKGLPKTMIVTVEIDPLRDDGILYVERLRKAGVDVVHLHHHDGFHGMVGPGMVLGRETIKDMITFLHDNL